MKRPISIVKKRRRPAPKKRQDMLKAAFEAVHDEQVEATATTAPGVKTIETEQAAALTPKTATHGKLTTNEANERALKFLIDLAQRRDSEIQAGGWGPALREFGLFLQRAERIRIDFDNDFEITNPTMLVREIQQGLNSFLNNGEWETPELKIHRWLCFGTNQNRPVALAKSDSQHDAILFGLVDLLLEHGDRIRLCAADECPRIFLANKRQTFCSKHCRQKELQRRFIENLGGANAYIEYRSRAYERRIRKKFPNAKVARRPRSKSKMRLR